MATCPKCGQRAEELHPIPPAIVTRGLIEDLTGSESPLAVRSDEWVLCVDCHPDAG